MDTAMKAVHDASLTSSTTTTTQNNLKKRDKFTLPKETHAHKPPVLGQANTLAVCPSNKNTQFTIPENKEKNFARTINDFYITKHHGNNATTDNYAERTYSCYTSQPRDLINQIEILNNKISITTGKVKINLNCISELNPELKPLFPMLLLYLKTKGGLISPPGTVTG